MRQSFHSDDCSDTTDLKKRPSSVFLEGRYYCASRELNVVFANSPAVRL
jgi:hypothetical protein